jgi:hypothetical protein
MSMAKPPEPIDEVIPRARWVVDAEVSEVIRNGALPPKKAAPAGATSVGNKSQSQTVKLKVKRVLLGEAGTQELVAEKPEAGYALREGNHGPFILDESKTILGRYGPDSYSWQKIEAALKAQKK